MSRKNHLSFLHLQQVLKPTDSRPSKPTSVLLKLWVEVALGFGDSLSRAPVFLRNADAAIGAYIGINGHRLKYESFSVYLFTGNHSPFRTSFYTIPAFEACLGHFICHVTLLSLSNMSLMGGTLPVKGNGGRCIFHPDITNEWCFCHNKP